MIETICTMTFLARCDHCGLAAASPGRDSQEAREIAAAQGWHISDWLHFFCPRQTVFCPVCHQKLQEKT